jgi:hypothetical protein
VLSALTGKRLQPLLPRNCLTQRGEARISLSLKHFLRSAVYLLPPTVAAAGASTNQTPWANRLELGDHESEPTGV